jgi:pyruvate dehydrogenase E2 component (dihydrolipoamide acetyltransferase)
MPIQITMPALSPTMTEGNLAKWLKSEGDAVEAGDVIAEIETDKATMEVEAVDEGIIGKILVAEGTQAVAVNAPIAILLEDGESADDLSGFSGSAVSAAPPAPTVAPAAPAENKPAPEPVPQAPAQNKGNRIFASPLARRIAEQKGVDLASLKGSGPHGRIVKADVEGAKAGAPSQVSASAAGQPPIELGGDEKINEFGMIYTETPNNNIKKITAKRLLESKTTVPHFYLTVECVLDELLAARKAMNEQANGEYKLSVNDFIIKANAMALQAYPAANVSWDASADGTSVTRQFKHSDISVAVATPNGLITPIIKKAETKGLRAISGEMKEMAGRAREGKLKPEEFQGGTFSISNLGMFGVSEFAAIVNPPQSCIMAVGAGTQQPVVVNGAVEIKTVMKVTLSTDHRTVDGAVGAEFLQYFKRYIENPVSMLV